MFSSAPFATVAFAAIGGALFFTAVVEGAVAAETSTAQLSVPASVNEQAQGADSLSTTGSFAHFVNEQAQGADTVSVSVLFPVSLLEGTGANDTAVSRVGFSVSLQDGASGSDTVTAAAVFAVAIQEAGVSADSLLGRLLWEVVQTAQSQDWKSIATVQLSLRITVGGGFSSGAISSGPISGLGGDTRIATAPDTWQNINNVQGVTWTPIKTA